MNQASVKLFLDTRKEKANNKFPVKLTIYCHQEKKRYRTGIDLSEREWEKVHSGSLRDQNLKDAKLKLDSLTTKAAKIIKGIEEFSFSEFEENFLTQKKDRELVLPLFQEYVDDLKAQGQIGTAITYNTTMNSLKEFGGNLRIKDIKPDFLARYEKWHQAKGNSNTTIGINLRNIRRIVNVAIQKGLMKQEQYPFKKYIIPGGQNIKKALRQEDIKALLTYEFENEKEEKALDMWLFSYLCNGMNMADIARLKWADIDGEFLSFFRAKTIRTKKRDSRPVRVALHVKARKIIEKREKGVNKENNPYVFRILDPGISPLTEKHRIQALIKFVNKHMKEIASKLGITLTNNLNLTTYVARHTFSTVLKRKGVPIEEISEFLGHANIATTKSYLDSFSDEKLKERNKLLID